MTQLAKDWLAALGPFAGWMMAKAVLWAVVFGFLGLLLALYAMWTLHKRRLLHRTHNIWNMAAKLSHVVILAALVAAGAAYGVLSTAQSEINRAVTEYAQPALAANMPALRAQLAEHVGPMATEGMVTARDLVQPIVKDFLYQPKSDGMWERAKAWFINRLVMEAGARALTQAVQQGLQLLPEVVRAGPGAKGQLAEFSVDALTKVLAGAGQKVDFSALDKTIPEVFADALHGQIDSFFKGIYTGLLIKLALVAMLIAAEMTFYFRYYLPRQASPATKAPTSAA